MEKTSSKLIMGITLLGLLMASQALGARSLDSSCASAADCKKSHACKVGPPICQQGSCICIDKVLARSDRTCSSSADCKEPRFCKVGLPICQEGHCICID